MAKKKEIGFDKNLYIAKGAFQTLEECYLEAKSLQGRNQREKRAQVAAHSLHNFGVMFLFLCGWIAEDRERLLSDAGNSLPPSMRYAITNYLADEKFKEDNWMDRRNSSRLCIASLLFDIGTGAEDSGFKKLAAGLCALEQGEVLPFLQPSSSKKGKHGNQFSLRELKRAVVMWKYVLYGRELVRGVRSQKLAEGRLAKIIKFSAALVRKIEGEVKHYPEYPNEKKFASLVGEMESAKGTHIRKATHVDALGILYVLETRFPLHQLGEKLRENGIRSAEGRHK